MIFIPIFLSTIKNWSMCAGDNVYCIFVSLFRTENVTHRKNISSYSHPKSIQDIHDNVQFLITYTCILMFNVTTSRYGICIIW